jgi:hypothetical protein
MKKDNRVAVRLSDKEFMALDVISKREYLNISETLRLLIREGINKRGLLSVGLITLQSKYEK